MLKLLEKSKLIFFLHRQIKKHHTSKLIMFFIALGILLFGLGYWLYSRNYITTDDAYVKANVVQISPQIRGKVVKVNTVDNAFVHQDQVLFQIDPAPFLIALSRAEAQLSKDMATLENLRVSTSRIFTLVKRNFLSQQEKDDFIAKLKGAEAMVKLDEADLNQARLNMQYTEVPAPTDGWVTDMTLRPGDSVDTAQPVFALVSNREFWVEANVKETDLQQIRPGQSATITIDMYPAHPFHGVVDSLSRGSGEAFSLLPPQNATGNWVKVAQRIPVKVRIIDPSPAYPLRISTTATVTIHVRSRR